MQQQVRSAEHERLTATQLRVQHEREGQQRAVKVAGPARQEKDVMPEHLQDIPGIAKKAQAVQDQRLVVQLVAEAELQRGRIEQAARQRYTGRQLPGKVLLFRFVYKFVCCRGC